MASFGYGLSYTSFEYRNLKADEAVATDAKAINLSFEVKNTGKVAADEIAQVYISPKNEGQNIRPIQLQGFARVSLQPGETKTVNVKLYTEQFGCYEKRQWNIRFFLHQTQLTRNPVDIFKFQIDNITPAHAGCMCNHH